MRIIDQSRIDYLKREIKRTYKRYTGERTDGKASLVDVANFFNIPIDESRLDDYVVKNFDYKTPSIEIFDTRNNVSHTAKYTNSVDLLRFFCIGAACDKFIEVQTTSDDCKVDSFYWIDGTTPIISKMTFTDGNYKLAFTKELKNNLTDFSTDGVKFSICYSTDVDIENGRTAEQELLTRIFKKDGYYTKHFEYLYTYGSYHMKREGELDKYLYIENGNIIYGINELEQKGICSHVRGICFESKRVKVEKYLPLNMRYRDYPGLSDEKVQSAMVFTGWTEKSKQHYLEIYKRDGVISVHYEAKNHMFEEKAIVPHPIITEVNQNLDLPTSKEGNITSEEIAGIILALETNFENDDFIAVILDELREFGHKIDIKNGVVEEELDPLSPKLLIDKPFSEIYALVFGKKKDYFDLAREQFETAIHATKSDKLGQSKAHKPEKPKQ